MAEEKETKKKTTSVKSTTTKKKASAEVKVEKRFCTRCGKELKEGENCSCNEVVSVNTEALKGIGSTFLNTILGMFKKPATTLDKELERKDTTGNMIVLVAIAISFGLSIMASITSILSLSFEGFRVNDLVDIPYFKIFLYMTIIYILLSFIPVTAAFVVSKLTGNHEFDYKKSISLYTTSMAPTILTNLLMALLSYLDILSWVGAIIGAVVSTACFFHYMLGYLRANNINEDKKSYALTALVVIWVVTFIIAFVIFAGSLVSDISKDVGIKTNNPYSTNNNRFSW